MAKKRNEESVNARYSSVTRSTSVILLFVQGLGFRWRIYEVNRGVDSATTAMPIRKAGLKFNAMR